MTENETRSRTARVVALVGVLTLTAVAILILAALPSGADGHEITTEPLAGRHLFTDDIALQLRLKPEGRPRTVVNLPDPTHLTVLRITVPPGARFPWHTHPGPVMVAVTEGELVYVYADDCVHRLYDDGTSSTPPATPEAFVDPGGSVHMAFNPTEETTVLTAVFFGAPSTGPVTLPVDEDQATALDEACGTTAASHAH